MKHSFVFLLKRIIILNIFAAIPFLGYSQHYISKEKQLADMEFLHEKLSLIHPALKTPEKKERFDKEYAAVVNGLKDDSLRLELFSENLGRIIRSIGCGHTFISGNTVLDSGAVRGLPFFFDVDENKNFVSKNSLSESVFPSGSVIHAIQGIPINDIVNKVITRAKAVDNFISSGIEAQAARILQRHYEYLYGKRDSLLISYTFDGRRMQANVPLISSDSVNKAFVNSKFDIYKENSLVKNTENYQIKRWVISNFIYEGGFLFGGLKYRKRLNKQFKEIKESNPTAIIVDLRNNSGGSVKSALELLKYFAPSEFEAVKSYGFHRDSYPYLNSSFAGLRMQKVYKKNGADANGWVNLKPGKGLLKTVKPERNNFSKIPMVFMINGRTFSAATMVANQLQEFGYKSVGTETGGAQWGSYAGILKKITLPNSKAEVTIPLLRKQNSDNLPYQGGVKPDFEIYPTINNLKLNQDAVMKKALYILQDSSYKSEIQK